MTKRYFFKCWPLKSIKYSRLYFQKHSWHYFAQQYTWYALQYLTVSGIEIAPLLENHNIIGNCLVEEEKTFSHSLPTPAS